jgi:cellulose biosynthesis protein BcsQ
MKHKINNYDELKRVRFKPMNLKEIYYWIEDYQKLNGDDAVTTYMHPVIDAVNEVTMNNDDLLPNNNVLEEYEQGSQYDLMDDITKNAFRFRLTLMIWSNLN